MLLREVVEVSQGRTKYGMHFQIMSANAIDANAGAKLLKKIWIFSGLWASRSEKT